MKKDTVSLSQCLRRTPLASLILALGVLLTAANNASGKTVEKPNVIVILTDDQGWGDVGFNGCQDIPTPYLDRLAAEGVVFDAGYAAHPYCSPSRAGFITGRFQQRYGHENNTPYKHDDPEAGLPLEEKTIADTLRASGYATAAVGKWHLGDYKKFWPNERGFDDWFGFYGGGLDYWGQLKGKNEEAGVQRNGEIVPQSELTYLTDDFTDEAIAFIERHKQEPFFLYLAYNAPHLPLQAPKRYLDRVAHIEDPVRAAYAAMVVGVDDGVGRIVQRLNELGLYENTLIVFFSDNGGHGKGSMNYPFRGKKGMLFEGGIRVPFSMTWRAGLPAGKRVAEPVTAYDLYPSIAQAVGLEGQEIEELSLDGINLLPYLKDNDKALPERSLYWRYTDGEGYAVRKGNYKLVRSAYKEGTLLFDVVADPIERFDLTAAMPWKAQELQDLYERWSADKIPGKWQDPHVENIQKDLVKQREFLEGVSAGERAPKQGF